MEMPCNLFQLTTFPRCMTNLVLPFRQWGLQMGSAMGLFSLTNDYKYKVNPIDQWVKNLVTVTGVACTCLSTSFSQTSFQNLPSKS